jgi:hypothetical protein
MRVGIERDRVGDMVGFVCVESALEMLVQVRRAEDDYCVSAIRRVEDYAVCCCSGGVA